ncbi:hypothetical protein [Scytonema sp. HK-05]|nr:hypothetical protein [Scytonema sp. HK-05]
MNSTSRSYQLNPWGKHHTKSVERVGGGERIPHHTPSGLRTDN